MLNLRGGPGTSADVLTGKKYGTCGIIVTDACKGSWCPVDDGHYQGWVSGRFIAKVSPARYCVTGVPPRRYLEPPRVSISAKPGGASARSEPMLHCLPALCDGRVAEDSRRGMGRLG
ncbi:SH3 domain-containing protein [Aurantimonas endophytica]|uniref:SH3 domain-containing protein n=1 Tax=Aurantimonas endophytica TaxID=1522175 RepID=UPI00338E272A